MQLSDAPKSASFGALVKTYHIINLPLIHHVLGSVPPLLRCWKHFPDLINKTDVKNCRCTFPRPWSKLIQVKLNRVMSVQHDWLLAMSGQDRRGSSRYLSTVVLLGCKERNLE